MAEIARDLELSESRISQMHSETVLRIRSQRMTKPNAKEIEDAIERTEQSIESSIKTLELLKRLRELFAPTTDGKKRGRPAKVA